MATKAWFDYATYMAHKLTWMQETYPNEKWTASSLQKAFEDAGFVGDEGAQRHFQKYGHTEDVSPNQYFDAQYYYKAKAIQSYGLAENGGLTKAEVEAKMDTYAKNMEGAIKAAGMDAWTHYIKYGTAEGVNPSNEFDTSDYMAAKLAALQAAEPSAGWNETSMNAAFKKAGLNALEHYMQYANKGTGEVTSTDISDFAVPASEQIEDTKTDGQTTDFTTGTDKIVGTDGNDTFNGVWGGATGESTYQVGDTLTDPSTTDTDVLNVRLNSVDASPYVAVKNVETINLITSATGQTAIFDASGVTGAKKMMVNQQTNAAGTAVEETTINGITSLDTAVGVNGKGGVIAYFDSTLLTGSSDTVKVALEGAGTSSLHSSVDVANNNTVEAIAIESTGTNYVDLTGGTKAATYTVTGDGVNTIKLESGEPKEITFDASAATNSQSVTFTGTQTVTATGGKGDDNFSFGDTLDKNDVIDGGEGENTVAATIAAANLTPNMKNVQSLDAVFKSGSFNGSKSTDLKTVTVVRDAEAAATALNFTKMGKSVSTLNLEENSANATVSFSYDNSDKDNKGELTINVGENWEGINATTNKANTGSDVTYGAVTIANADKVVLNSVVDPDNTKAVTNTIDSVSASGATAMEISTAELADLTITNGLSDTAMQSLKLTVATDTTLDLGTGFASPSALTSLTANVGEKGALELGTIGSNSEPAAKLSTFELTAEKDSAVSLVALDAIGGAASAALSSVKINLGDGVSVDNVAGIAAPSGTLGNITAATGGATVAGATLSTVDIDLGKLGATPESLGTITAKEITSATIDLADQAKTGGALTVGLTADKVGSVETSVGANGTLTLNLDGLNTTPALTAGVVNDLVLKGEGDATIGVGTQLGVVKNVDASELEGTFTLDMSAGTGLIATGTTTINMAKGIDQITLSTEIDTVRFNSELIAGSTATTVDSVTNFTGGTDKISFMDLGIDNSNVAANGAALGTLANYAATATLDGGIFGVGAAAGDVTDQATEIAAIVTAVNGATVAFSADDGKAIAIYGATGTAGASDIYLIESAGAGEDISASNVTFIGTVSTDTTDFQVADFISA